MICKIDFYLGNNSKTNSLAGSYSVEHDKVDEIIAYLKAYGYKFNIMILNDEPLTFSELKEVLEHDHLLLENQ